MKITRPIILLMTMLAPALGQASDRFMRTVPVANQPVVSDSVTGLVWQGCAAGLSGDTCATGSVDTRIWQQALAYCEGLSWGGHTDWRLPNVGELDSIIDDRRSSRSIDVTAFPATPWSLFWSSSPYAFYTDLAWAVHSDHGHVNYYVKSDTYHVRCVRAGP